MSHIFISHATKDDDVVTRIHDQLEAATQRELWVDHRDLMPPVANYRQSIHEALQTCSGGLIVLSKNSVHRPEIVSEWTYLLNIGVDLLVAKIDDVPIKDVDYRLHIIQWVDLTKDWDAGIKALAAGIVGGKLPEDAPVYTVRRVTGRIDRRLTTIPMSGRDDDLKKVKDLLRRAPTMILGFGGVGKSRLAAEVALTSEDTQGAIWHVISDVSRPDEVLELLRDHFDLPTDTAPQDVLKPLHTHKRLIVLDNAEAVEKKDERRRAYAALVDDLLGVGAQVLLTSRVEWEEIEIALLYHLEQLTPEAAEKIVLDMADAFNVPHDLKPLAADFATAARRQPGLIEWAVRQTRKFPPDKVMRDLRDLKSQKVQDALDEMIRKTVKQMTDAESADAENALKRLNVCRGGFTYDAAKAILDPDGDEDTLDAVLETLQTWQFVTMYVQDGKARYNIDPLVITAVGEDENARRPHYDYYKALARQHDEQQDYYGLDVESANLEAAFEWAITADAESALRLADACWRFLQNRGRFEQNLDWCQRVAAALAEHPDESLRADAQNNLGIAYRDLAQLEEREANLKRAIAAFEAALQYYTPERAPLAYAMTQNNLGTAYVDLAQLEEREANLKRAIAAFEAALQYYTPERAPLDYAMTQNNLGAAYADLAQLEEREANLKRAIAAYQAALEYYTPERAPLDYAMTQNNLGAAYRDLSELEEREANLKRAIAAYQAALEYRTPERAPLDYATTQNNLGIAYEDSGDLNAAIKYWREAEKYYRLMGHTEDADEMLRWIEDAEKRMNADTGSTS